MINWSNQIKYFLISINHLIHKNQVLVNYWSIQWAWEILTSKSSSWIFVFNLQFKCTNMMPQLVKSQAYYYWITQVLKNTRILKIRDRLLTRYGKKVNFEWSLLISAWINDLLLDLRLFKISWDENNNNKIFKIMNSQPPPDDVLRNV